MTNLLFFFLLSTNCSPEATYRTLMWPDSANYDVYQETGEVRSNWYARLSVGGYSADALLHSAYLGTVRRSYTVKSVLATNYSAETFSPAGRVEVFCATNYLGEPFARLDPTNFARVLVATNHPGTGDYTITNYIPGGRGSEAR